MRRLLPIMLSIVALFAACSDEEDNNGESYISNVTADFAEALTDSEGSVTRAVTDNGDTLIFLSPLHDERMAVADSAYRAVIYYNKVEGNTVSVVSMSPISVLTPFDSHKLPADSVFTDPVGLISLWKSGTGKYLNFHIKLMSGSSDDESLHEIGVMQDGISLLPDEHKSLDLRLYHNQNGIPMIYGTEVYFSVALSPYSAILGAGDQANVTVNTLNGTMRKSFDF